MVTCWLDPGTDGEPFGATVSFTGYRTGVEGKHGPGDTFARRETVEPIVPGSGPVAISTEVRGINPGTWKVTAKPVRRKPPGVDRVPWPRHITVTTGTTSTIRTRSLLFAKIPGVVRFVYPTLVAAGVLIGLAVEMLLLSTSHYQILRPLLLSLAAVAAGVIGGKAWYIAVHRGHKADGWCIQGFVAGAAVVVAVAALAGPGIPPGVFLSAAAPALLIGMGIGRPGCFWAGCCVGRPTASRWAIWSSDRKVGCRRHPAQLMEAFAALLVGLGVLAVVLVLGLARSGPAAATALAGYTLARQFIVALRAEPPYRLRYGRLVTTVAASGVLVASVILLSLGGT
jgi:phosphatidylglycerol---prolipoprotein diacylglyceryl transferase